MDIASPVVGRGSPVQAHQLPWTGPWAVRSDQEQYEQAVQLALGNASVSADIGRTRGLTRDRLRDAALGDDFVLEAFASSRSEYAAYRREAVDYMRADLAHEEVRTTLALERWLKWCLGVIAAGVLWQLPDQLLFDGASAGVSILVVVFAGVAIAIKCLESRDEGRDVSLVALFRAWRHLNAAATSLRGCTRAWRTQLDAAVLAQLQILVKQWLGDSSMALMPDEGHEGLRDVHDPKYVVPTRADRLLRQKLNELDGGTIAVCGPRGAGKSTLLRTCSTRADRLDLTVQVHAPADYTPQDFLLTLFGQVCEQYLEFFGDVPSERTVFATVTRSRRVLRALRSSAKWLLSFAAASALITVALWRPAAWGFRRLTEKNLPTHATHWATSAWNVGHRLWHQHPWISGVIFLLIALRLMPRLRRPPRTYSTLAQQCQRYLFRLRTAQNAGAAVNAGFTRVPGLSVGASRSTSVSSIPLTFPQLVTEFRALLAQIAKTQRIYGGRVVIAIDEVDRIGDPESARKFLSQIKAIFGIENVYYLVSVSDDIAAAFVRRGLPHRDVTDSSLDDLLYLPPGTLGESRRLLALRAPAIPADFVELVHALSGGIPRDLIRYSRRLLEASHWTDRLELKDLAPQLVCQDLGDALDGFRTLLSAEQWTTDNAHLLADLHDLVRLLHSVTEANSAEARAKISELACRPLPVIVLSGGKKPEPLIADTVATLWQEASACALFALTLLEIYADPGLPLRRQFAESNGRDGKAQRLAEARLELAASPHSARIMINAVRAAWGLTSNGD